MQKAARNIMALMIFITVLVIAGCSASLMTTFNVNQPVLLGHVRNVSGETMERRRPKETFDITLKAGNSSRRDSPVKADIELLKRIDSPKDQVAVEEVSFGSWGSIAPVYIVLVPLWETWVGMKGTIQ